MEKGSTVDHSRNTVTWLLLAGQLILRLPLPALAGKEVVVMGSYNDAECARGVIGMFEDFKGWIGIKLQIVEHGAQSGPVSEHPAKLEEAYALGQAMALRLVQTEAQAHD